ncbi:hypothetical protein FFT09_02315 [Saccharomonospora piscinae]|uniref:sensor histidine kinase n=1 Tax=Saccharomonospora piscinae TaxID=687388 RepID=UPI001105C4F3|nr:ATP-binding protein [Saccharomonospora piscinae]TLW94730.1 hypothetical protein FFT09_02315 [Saccharomonospora piscinae]
MERTGESVRRLGRFGRRYAAALRLAILLPLGTIALLRAGPAHLPATVLVVAVVVLWTAAYCWWSARSESPAPVVADVLVLLAVSSSVLVTDAVEDVNVGWLRLLITFACVAWQWHTPPLTGGLAALVSCGGLVAVVALAGGEAPLLRSVAWAAMAALLSRASWTLVRRAARRADRAADEAALARREALVATAVRAEERDLATALHDTAATTLLMVGTGQVSGSAEWLPGQARRDLDRLRSDPGHATGHTDLVDLVRTGLATTRLRVDFDAPPSLRVPSGVARAIADAAGEALANVRRHAGTDEATVRLTGDTTGLRLDIVDKGAGFDTADVAVTRRGLRESVHGRLSRIGGCATVTSAPGEGTVVELAWSARHD